MNQIHKCHRFLAEFTSIRVFFLTSVWTPSRSSASWTRRGKVHMGTKFGIKNKLSFHYNRETTNNYQLSNPACYKCGRSSHLFNIRSLHCCYYVGWFVTVIGTSPAIWSEGTHTCVTGHDFFFPPNVLFLYKIEINHKSLFILSEKILIFQVKVFFPKWICGVGCFVCESDYALYIYSRYKDVVVLLCDKKTASLKFMDLKCILHLKQQVH